MLRRRFIVTACAALIGLSAINLFAKERGIAPPPADDRPLVQVALLLDTSNSMDGLINQARTQLWKIVNEISKCQRDGQVPHVQVALFEYGNNGIAAGENYVRMVLPFGENLDDVSEKLFALKTNGGEEYCGAVIQSATNGLQWNSDPKVYKSIFICGNEPFTQGNVDFHTAVPAAFARGIIVNTIHCGPREQGVQGQWSTGADLGRGKFLNIDQDRQVTVITTPFDPEIQKLSIELNVTYIPYGAHGARSSVNQAAQDYNASAGSAAERAMTKSGKAYDNSTWDLVDALDRKAAKLEDIKDADLPEAIRGKSLEEKQKYVDAQSAKRAELQKQIIALNAKRDEFVKANTKADAARDTLDAALIEAIRTQLKAQSYDLPK